MPTVQSMPEKPANPLLAQPLTLVKFIDQASNSEPNDKHRGY